MLLIVNATYCALNLYKFKFVLTLFINLFFFFLGGGVVILNLWLHESLLRQNMIDGWITCNFKSFSTIL